MLLEFSAFAAVFVIVSIALDAAFYWRFRNLLEIFRDVPDGLDYRHFAFPRLLLTAASAVVIAWGSYPRPSNSALIIAGGVVFMILNLYPQILMYRRSTRIK